MVITEEELSDDFGVCETLVETSADAEEDEESSSSSSIKFIIVLSTGFSGSFGGGKYFFLDFRNGLERALILIKKLKSLNLRNRVLE